MAHVAWDRHVSDRAFEHLILDQSAVQIVEAAERTGAAVAGPIPLPTAIEKFCVIRSPHIDKDSREQFEIRTHKRLIDILDRPRRPWTRSCASSSPPASTSRSSSRAGQGWAKSPNEKRPTLMLHGCALC